MAPGAMPATGQMCSGGWLYSSPVIGDAQSSKRFPSASDVVNDSERSAKAPSTMRPAPRVTLLTPYSIPPAGPTSRC